MPSNDDTPSGPLGSDPAGHIQRPLPQTKTVAEALAKRFGETGDPGLLQDSDPAKAGESLLAYNEEVLARLEKVNEFFKAKQLGKPLDPTQAKTFTDFVRDHLAYVNMRFVTLGRFERPGVEDPTTKTGFVQQGEPEAILPPDLDPMLRTMRSAHLAVASGADLVGNDEQEPA